MPSSRLATFGESGSFRLTGVGLALVHVLATVVISVGAGPGQTAEAADSLQAGRREPFAWSATYGEALQAARERSRPIVLYFPPVRDSDEPPFVAGLPKLFSLSPAVEGVRVGADELLQLMERFRIKKVPALVLIDLRENVLSGWQDGLAMSYLSTLMSAIRKFYRRESQDVVSIRDARRLARQGDLAGAYRCVASLLVSKHTSPGNLVAARRIEKSVLEEFERTLYAVLAWERLAPAPELRAVLKELRSRLSHPDFQRRVDREVLRLKRTEGRE